MFISEILSFEVKPSMQLKKKKTLIVFLVAVGPCCCMQALFSCSKQGLLLGVWASHCGGFSCSRAWALDMLASVVAAHGFSICGSQALEHRLSSCGILGPLALGHVTS